MKRIRPQNMAFISDIDSAIAGHKLVTFLNPFSYLAVRKSQVDMSKIDYLCSDGILLTWIIKLLLWRKISRQSFDFTSLANEVFYYCDKNNLKVAIIGSTKYSMENFQKRITELYPNIDFVCFRDGYFSESERNSFILSLKNSQPDVIIVGMGAVAQEQMLITIKDAGISSAGFTCGGFIHQTADSVEYYPKWVDKLNLRAFFRMYKEPKLMRRYLIDYPKGILIFIYDSIVE